MMLSQSFTTSLARAARKLGATALAASIGLACGGPLEADLDAPLETTEVATDAATAGFTAGLARALDIARRYPGGLDRFADGTHDGQDIAEGRIPAPRDGSALTNELLTLVQGAASYSEAILLLRVAGQDLARGQPEVPAVLSRDPRDPDWEFAGKNVALPYAVQQALSAMRADRDARLDVLSDADFDAHAAVEERIHLGRRRDVAAALGWRFDGRPDQHVGALPSGDIWRRKTPIGYVPPAIDEERGSATMPAGEPEELDSMLPTGVRFAILGGTDSRQLRSEWNGHDMQSDNWMAKGAMVSGSATTQEVPVRVDCSGTKIGQRLVATAGHCMFGDGAWNDNTRWIPGADGVAAATLGSDPSPNGFKSAWDRVVRTSWFDHEWTNYDFGIFVLHDNASSCTLPWHGWRKRSGLTNDLVHLYGYPGANGPCTVSPLANDACGGSIYGTSGDITYAGSYTIRYGIDTQPGQSGSGVYEIDGDRFLLGVHRGEYSSSRNLGVRINDGNRDMINSAKSDYPHTCN